MMEIQVLYEDEHLVVVGVDDGPRRAQAHIDAGAQWGQRLHELTPPGAAVSRANTTMARMTRHIQRSAPLPVKPITSRPKVRQVSPNQ